MNKVILFLWFGDEKPAYIQWTLENFRRMNPGWEIRYVEYSNDQIKNYKDVGDQVLVSAVDRNRRNHVNYIVDEYKRAYLEQHNSEIVVYCDLDCFPIAPFDDFMMASEAPLHEWNEWARNNHPCRHIHPKLMGCNWFRDEKLQEFMPDQWCIVNSSQFLNWHFLQLHKGSILDDSLIIHNGMFMNRSAIPAFNERTKAFHEMKIELGDNFCLPQFTPIEHYYSLERNKLNKGTIG